MKNRKTFTDQIIDSINNKPNDWKLNEFTFVNSKLHVSLWASNGFISLRIYEKESDIVRKFTIVEKWKIWKAFKIWNKKPIRIIEK